MLAVAAWVMVTAALSLVESLSALLTDTVCAIAQLLLVNLTLAGVNDSAIGAPLVGVMVTPYSRVSLSNGWLARRMVYEPPMPSVTSKSVAGSRITPLTLVTRTGSVRKFAPSAIYIASPVRVCSRVASRSARVLSGATPTKVSDCGIAQLVALKVTTDSTFIGVPSEVVVESGACVVLTVTAAPGSALSATIYIAPAPSATVSVDGVKVSANGGGSDTVIFTVKVSLLVEPSKSCA